MIIFKFKRQFINKPDISVKEETIEDAILATELLRNDSRIDSDKIFIIGQKKWENINQQTILRI